MIIDSIANAKKYYSVHPLFEKAFAYINSTDLATIEPGKYDIEGDNLKAVYFNKQGMSAAESI